MYNSSRARNEIVGGLTRARARARGCERIEALLRSIGSVRPAIASEKGATVKGLSSRHSARLFRDESRREPARRRIAWSVDPAPPIEPTLSRRAFPHRERDRGVITWRVQTSVSFSESDRAGKGESSRRGRVQMLGATLIILARREIN